MLENPTANLNVLSISCAKISVKQLYHINHSEFVTGTYELSFLTKTNTITSYSIELPLPPFHCNILLQFTQRNVYIFNEYYVSTELN